VPGGARGERRGGGKERTSAWYVSEYDFGVRTSKLTRHLGIKTVSTYSKDQALARCGCRLALTFPSFISCLLAGFVISHSHTHFYCFVALLFSIFISSHSNAVFCQVYTPPVGVESYF
jgi:hypothetical protein